MEACIKILSDLTSLLIFAITGFAAYFTQVLLHRCCFILSHAGGTNSNCKFNNLVTFFRLNKIRYESIDCFRGTMQVPRVC